MATILSSVQGQNTIFAIRLQIFLHLSVLNEIMVLYSTDSNKQVCGRSDSLPAVSKVSISEAGISLSGLSFFYILSSGLPSSDSGDKKTHNTTDVIERCSESFCDK